MELHLCSKAILLCLKNVGFLYRNCFRECSRSLEKISLIITLLTALILEARAQPTEKIQSMERRDRKGLGPVIHYEFINTDFETFHMPRDTGSVPRIFEFYNCTSTGVDLWYNENRNGIANFEQSCIDNLTISVGFRDIGFYNRNRFDRVSIGRQSKAILIMDNEINTFSILDSAVLTSFVVFDTNFKNKFSMSHCQVNVQNFYLDRFGLPDTLDLHSVSFFGGARKIRLNQYNPTEKICQMSLYGTDLDMLDLKYQNYRLYFPKSLGLTFEDKVSEYQRLLDYFQKRGMFQSYERLDKEFKAFKFLDEGIWYGRVFNWIDRHWWDYGYNKFLVVRNAIILNLCFFFINICLYGKLLNQTYTIAKFAEIERNMAHAFVYDKMKRLSYIFLYTAYIFWGLKLDIEKINISKTRLFYYVLLQYVTGVICLAYLANLIITV